MAHQLLTSADCDKIADEIFYPYKAIVSKYRIETLDRIKNGYLGEYSLLHLDAVGNDKYKMFKLFVKRIKLPNEIMEASHVKYNLFEKEVFIYSVFLECCKRNFRTAGASISPKCYLYKPEGILVLEDISNEYMVFNSKILPDRHIEVALKTVAKFHSLSYAIQEHYKHNNPDNVCLKNLFNRDLWVKESLFVNDPINWGYYMAKSSIQGIKNLLRLMPERRLTISEIEERYDILADKMLEIFTEENKFRKVLNHGDLWCNNLMFKYSKSDDVVDCKLIDFQMIRYVPPAHDVTFLIFHNTEHLSKIKFQYFVKYYYKELTNCLHHFSIDIVDVLPEKEFLESIKYYFPVTLLMKIIFRNMTLRLEDCTTSLCKSQKEFDKMFFGDRSKFLLEQFETDHSYREYMIQLLTQLQTLLEDGVGAFVKLCL